MKRYLINFVKIAISLGIITWLVVDVQRNNPESFQRLASEPKNWLMLAGAWALVTAAVVTTFVRWYFLVRALDLPFTLQDALRLGFLGYLLNFISLGSVGGDLFKAVFIAREQPGRRTEAVMTVIVDRLMGLYGLLVVASCAVLLVDVRGYNEQVRSLCDVTMIVTGVATVGLVAVLCGVGIEGPVAGFLCRMKRGGAFFQTLVDAARTYRRKPRVLALGFLLTLGVHSMCAIAFYFIAVGLPEDAPTLAAHFFIVPLGMVSGAIPLPMGALGAFEAVMKYLYHQVAAAGVSDAQGLLVALAYRVITILVALVGVAFYVVKRREVDRVLHDTEEIEDGFEPAMS